MGTPSTQLRITTDANDALKEVAARFPAWSLAQLANTLLLEACRACLGKTPAALPTVGYIRQQLGISEPNSLDVDIKGELACLRDVIVQMQGRQTESFALNESPPMRESPSQAQARRAAGK